MVYAVVGCNYGDEGKGLATDYLALREGKNLGIRHNGGAQSGHTVEIGSNRFVFHELSSGSFRGADTFWASTYYPDMFKLGEELDNFEIIYKSVGRTDGRDSNRVDSNRIDSNRDRNSYRPHIYAASEANITIIDDIIVNQLAESLRGNNRHGSCGMGINEADLRTKGGYGVTFGELEKYSKEAFIGRLREIRREYTVKRIAEVISEVKKDRTEKVTDENACLDGIMTDFLRSRAQYIELLGNEDILINFAEQVMDNLKYIEIVRNQKELFRRYDNLIFEGGQGLRLDADYEANWPHVTASKTGITNPVCLLEKLGMKLDEVLYVTRTYLTKHGAGPIEAGNLLAKSSYSEDITNQENPWQGAIRYASFGDLSEFGALIKKDINNCPYPLKRTLLVTHLNETGGQFITGDRRMSINEFLSEAQAEIFDEVLGSQTHFSQEICALTGNMCINRK